VTVPFISPNTVETFVGIRQAPAITVKCQRIVAPPSVTFFAYTSDVNFSASSLIKLKDIMPIHLSILLFFSYFVCLHHIIIANSFF
jgi:hypothetical protein